MAVRRLLLHSLILPLYSCHTGWIFWVYSAPFLWSHHASLSALDTLISRGSRYQVSWHKERSMNSDTEGEQCQVRILCLSTTNRTTANRLTLLMLFEISHVNRQIFSFFISSFFSCNEAARQSSFQARQSHEIVPSARSHKLNI